MNSFITIDKRFEKSINLFFDLGNQEKVKSYIKTPSSEKILDQYMEGLEKNSTDRVSILIGPYGKGKSHLLLVLLDQLEKRKKPYLPVLISYGQQDLKHEFLLGLKLALQRAGIHDIKPDSYYTEAIRQIQLWKKEYPATYENLELLLSKKEQDIEKLLEALENQSEPALDSFRQMYPKLTAGSVFEPLIQTDLKENFMSMNRQLSQKYGYAGMFIVFDEFGKYIEGHHKEGYENDMKVLQDMCELAVKTREPQLHITLVTHKSIKEYSNTVDKRILDGFMGIEGRIKEIYYVDSTQNYYDIIANVVKKDEKVFEQTIQKNPEIHFDRWIDENYQLPVFASMFTKEEFYRKVGVGCFPLTPVAAYMLLQISQRVAQNERTIFTFLAGNDENGLENLISQQKKHTFIGAQVIYDYFENTFREEIGNIEIHREWLKAAYALELVEEQSQRNFIKVLTIISMLHRDNELPPTDIHIRLALGMEIEEYEKVKKALIEKKLLLYRTRKGICQLKNNVGIDIEEEIRQVSGSIHVSHRIKGILDTVWDIPYELPKRYNSQYKMTRFFSYEFLYPEDFFACQTFSYLFEEKFSDGKIILLLEHTENNKIYEKLQALGDKRIIVINPDSDFQEEALLQKYEAILKCKQDEEFVNHNQVILGELEWYEQDVYFEINTLLEYAYLPEYGQSTVCSLCVQNPKKGMSAKEYNRLLSHICDAWYEKAPAVNHELINRNHVSSQIKNARRKLLEEILRREDMSSYHKGTSAQASIYRAVFLRTEEDMGVKEIQKIIHAFLKKACGTKRSFAKLYEQLQGKHYGVRKGIIPLYVAQELSRLHDMPVLYCKDHEVSLEAVILENIEEKPEEYEIYIEQSTMEKKMYISKLWKLFAEKETESDISNHGINQLVEHILAWYRGLPGYTCSYQDGLSRNQIRFRNMLKGQDKNARDFLFEDILEILETTDYEHAFLFIKETKAVFDNHMNLVYEKMGTLVRQTFGASPEDDMHNILQSWRHRREEYITHNVCSASLLKLADFAKNVSGYEDNAILAEMSKIILDVYPENWSENSCDAFISKLQQILAQIQTEKNEKGEDGKKLQFVASDGQVIEKYYEEATEEGMEVFLENAIDDAFEEFGDAIDNGGKVAILVKMLEKVIKGEH